MGGADRCVRRSTKCGAVFFDLPEDPWVGRSHAADHDGVAAGLGDHGAGVFWSTDVAVADHGNLHGVFDGRDPFPAGLAAVTLFAGAGVERDGGEPAAFGHACEFDADDLVLIPSGAEFHGEGNFHRGTDGFEI